MYWSYGKKRTQMDEKLIDLFTPPTSYCIDANYFKGITVEQFIKKRRRQLIMDVMASRPGFRVRKLTQKECWRLMGFDDKDFESAKSAMNDRIYHGNDKCGSQLYKQAGNSIVVDVLLHIMENLYDAMPYLFEDITVGSFFSGIGAFEKALTRLDPTNGEKSTGDLADVELRQLGYINNYNGDANRIYDGSTISRALKAEAGGGGAKTGWYSVPQHDTPPNHTAE